MRTEKVIFDGVPLIIPQVLTPEGKWVTIGLPYDTIKEFSSYCGPGGGFGDAIVPETLLWLKISPACFIHDIMWAFARNTELDADFEQTNDVFRLNMNMIIKYKSKSWILEHLRYYWAVHYYNAVDTLGKSIFYEKKRRAEKNLEL